MTLRLRMFAASALLLLFSGAAMADGFYIPPPVTKTLPRIPSQRVVITWHDGQEELIVQSDMSGAGDRMAWILPIPAMPTAVAEAPPGIFTTLHLAIRPMESPLAPFTRTFLALFIGAWGVFQVLDRRWAPGRAAVYALTFSIFVFACFGRVYGRYITLGDSVGPDTAVGGVDVREMGLVGNYHVQVLQAKNAAALNQWLSGNEFQKLPADGEKIAEKYISEGWVFVAARLQRHGERDTRPHPLAVSFPVAAPVYPMRLTQLAHSDVNLDLYVISDKRAQSKRLETVYCQKYRRIRDSEHPAVQGQAPSWQEAEQKDVRPNKRARQEDAFALGLPSLVARMGEEGVVTHLQGVLRNRHQDEDLDISFEPFRPVRKSVWLWPQSLVKAVESALFVLGLLLTLLCFWRHARRWRDKPARHFPWMVPVCIGISVGVGLWAWSALPRGDILTGAGMNYFLHGHAERVVKTLQAWPELFGKMSRQEIEDYFAGALDGRKNEWTGMPFELGEGPGQLQILEDERGIVLREFEDLRFARHKIGKMRGPFIGLPIDTVIRLSDGSIPPPDPDANKTR